MSRTPEELQEIIKTLGELDQSLVAEGKKVQPAELDIKNAIRKGVVYSRDLLAGDILSVNELNYARPLNPDVPNFESVLGSGSLETFLRFTQLDRMISVDRQIYFSHL